MAKLKSSKRQGAYVQYPLSRDEHAAMARYLSGITKQVQDVSDLFTARYGSNSKIAESAVKTLVAATILEHEMLLLEVGAEPLERTVTEEAHLQAY